MKAQAFLRLETRAWAAPQKSSPMEFTLYLFCLTSHRLKVIVLDQ